jgi:hypothetical protein
VFDIDLPSVAAHIHTGEAGVAGDVVVALGAPEEVGASSGPSSGTGCRRGELAQSWTERTKARRTR